MVEALLQDWRSMWRPGPEKLAPKLVLQGLIVQASKNVHIIEMFINDIQCVLSNLNGVQTISTLFCYNSRNDVSLITEK